MFILSGSAGGRSQIRVWAEVLPSEAVQEPSAPAALPAPRGHRCSWLVDGCLLPVSLHCLPSVGIHLFVKFPFCKDSSHIELRPSPVTSSKPDHLQRPDF